MSDHPRLFTYPSVEPATPDCRGCGRCGDCAFDRFGDMYTPNELRAAVLRRPDNVRLRDQWLAEYQAAGIDDDQDPSLFVLSVPAEPDETPEDFAGRVADAAQDVFAVRFLTPADFSEEATS